MKNKLVFAGVLLVLFIMGAAAGSIVYSAIYLASWVNYTLLKEWLPYALVIIIAAVTVVTAYFTYRFIRQCRMFELPKLDEDDILPMTIIIPALNEERTIVQCVDSLMAADYPKDKLEVIIAHEVSPRCSDCTPGLARELEKKYANVKVFPNENGHQGSKAGAINNCLGKATGTIIGIYDADHVIEKERVAKGVRPVRRE